MQTSCEFPVAINLHCKTIDKKVLKWAWEAGLFESPAELERCRLQKINWFASYLFPEQDQANLELITKFFLCLFLLDDLLDILIDKTMVVFLEGLKTGNPSYNNIRLQSLGRNLLLQHQDIQKEYDFLGGSEQWNKAWLEYLAALQWEIQTKIDNSPPTLEKYRLYRPKTSGVYLAILLIRQGKDMHSCISELLECSIARYICLSNDLASYRKELAIGDTHNEILILMESMGNTAVSWTQSEVKELRKSILRLTEQLCTNFGTCDVWLRRLLLLAGGCEAWTAKTFRYQAHINGDLGRK
ncbi:hypothetical protein LV84_04155 [Algoriphagus ratkowskyi]|uniref:Terpene synthase n=1 Tax=Algoriphagus ratkowskyi TaxID=57028 RepID=A0A2W7RGV8_9BACT|nr:terpene synthase family protein [Algoriphagus ratkowskyi]PZX49965.1 hypothetical protein LV84_04155 [Algoriphagus ratkowskyi]TXD75534.1 hypothetical protein ESW18_20190 [Algoriphagus ratkowskyi]